MMSSVQLAVTIPYFRASRAPPCSLADSAPLHGPLSPLARGNQAPPGGHAPEPGSIPAHAGQPTALARAMPRSWAYPRSVQGLSPLARGNPRLASCAFASRGLSPLARGNLAMLGDVMPPMRPIPARAGQPPYCHPPPRQCRAYPRSRGATAWGGSPCSACRGLSPLARGNRLTVLHGACGGGPIPARAGQPQSWRHRPSWNGAYPRSRGATKCMPDISHARLGLSPLARGNLTDKGIQIAGEGPIPARAGQP